jgi:DNA-binding NarL/FixJ family response regulator
VIKVLVVDDHPAVLTGLLVALRCEPGIVPVGGVTSAEEALAEARRNDVDVALVDYHLPDEDGLALCRRLKELSPAPRVLVYSAFAGVGLALPARVAGADGLLDKGVATDTLLDAIRAVSRGDDAMPAVTPDQMEAASARLDEDDLPILSMLVGGTPRDDVAQVLGIDRDVLDDRLEAMLKRLRRRSPDYHPGVH